MDTTATTATTATTTNLNSVFSHFEKKTKTETKRETVKTHEGLKSVLACFKKSKRPILNCIYVDANQAVVTDLDCTIIFKSNLGLENGLHQLDRLGLGKPIEAEDFPLMTKPAFYIGCLSLNFSNLKLVSDHCSEDYTRPYLRGVFFDKNYIVATDGHTMRSHETFSDNQAGIFPIEGIEILAKLIKAYKINNQISVKWDENFFVVENELFTFMSRKIAREFPKWQSIMPTKLKHEILVENFPKFNDLKPVLEKKNMAVKIEGKNGLIKLKPNAPEYTGPEFLIGACDFDFFFGVNYKLFHRAIEGMKTGVIKFNPEINCPMKINFSIVMQIKI